MHHLLWFVLALLAGFLALPSVWVGWQLDDYVHRWFLCDPVLATDLPGALMGLFAFLDGNPDQNRTLMDTGFMPWWSLESLRISFWRPLAAFTHWLDYQLWPNSPAIMHFHSLILLGGLVAVATKLYQRILGLT